MALATEEVVDPSHVVPPVAAALPVGRRSALHHFLHPNANRADPVLRFSDAGVPQGCFFASKGKNGSACNIVTRRVPVRRDRLRWL
jgi:hypothetical protein